MRSFCHFDLSPPWDCTPHQFGGPKGRADDRNCHSKHAAAANPHMEQNQRTQCHHWLLKRGHVPHQTQTTPSFVWPYIIRFHICSCEFIGNFTSRSHVPTCQRSIVEIYRNLTYSWSKLATNPCASKSLLPHNGPHHHDLWGCAEPDFAANSKTCQD